MLPPLSRRLALLRCLILLLVDVRGASAQMAHWVELRGEWMFDCDLQLLKMRYVQTGEASQL